MFWGDGWKIDIADIIEKCPNFQQVNAEHLKLSCLLQEIQVPIWKLEDINMDFILEGNLTQYG